MRRVACAERPNWRDVAEELGFRFHTIGGEPYWRGSSTMDMIGLMEEIGFVDVKYEGMAPNNYPWVTYGRKP